MDGKRVFVDEIAAEVLLKGLQENGTQTLFTQSVERKRESWNGGERPTEVDPMHTNSPKECETRDTAVCVANERSNIFLLSQTSRQLVFLSDRKGTSNS